MTTWPYLKQIIVSKGLSPQYVESEECYFIKAYDGNILISECVIIKSLHKYDKEDFEANFKTNSNKPSCVTVTSAASKTLPDGKKVYKRVVGVRASCVTGPNDIIWAMPFNWVKFMGIEVAGCEVGDYMSLYILDTQTGTMSTIPNYVLNQFGFDANMPKDFYKHQSEFDADLTLGLQVKIVYHSVSDKAIGVNFVMNEVK